jgi:general secretion pathway protein L
LLDTLAAALPDDTALDRLDINGAEIRIGGLTSNATDLLSLLSKNPNFSSAKATNAAVRDNATNKERFTFELRLKSGVNP